jgi:Protein of unknown function (DUF1822)
MSRDFSGANRNEFLLDEEAFQLEDIMLSSHQIDQAMQMSESILHPAEQWQVYLNTLARLGLQQWLQTRVPRLTCAVLPNQNLQVGAFQLSVVTVGSFTDGWVSISQLEIESPDANFYVLVEVLEEAQSTRVCGCLRQDELMARRQSQSLEEEGERSHLLPLDWFDLNVDRLLLYVQYLEPAALSIVASNPVPLANRGLIDVGYWLRERLDEMAQELAWVLLPPPTYSSAMRGGVNASVEQFDTVMAELVEQGVEISSQARGAYREVQLGDRSLLLYVVIWKIVRSFPVEWTLLAILGTQSGKQLSAGIKLSIRDQAELLDEQILPSDQAAALVYTQAFGTLNERLWVAIENRTGERVTLPPFTLSENEN